MAWRVQNNMKVVKQCTLFKPYQSNITSCKVWYQPLLQRACFPPSVYSTSRQASFCTVLPVCTPHAPKTPGTTTYTSCQNSCKKQDTAVKVHTLQLSNTHPSDSTGARNDTTPSRYITCNILFPIPLSF